MGPVQRSWVGFKKAGADYHGSGITVFDAYRKDTRSFLCLK
jgi:hypothetical protein